MHHQGSEILSRFIKRAQTHGPLVGIRLAPNLDWLTHLFFADDVLLFAAASTRIDPQAGFT